MAPAMPIRLPIDGEHQSLGGEQAAHARRAEADRAQQADLARALLDAEPEEQRREHQRRDDEEEAEVGEVLAEVGRAARRGQPFARGRRATVRPIASGIEPRPQRRLDSGSRGRLAATGPPRDAAGPTCDRRSATATAAGPPRAG